jgi:hypothetical protein
MPLPKSPPFYDLPGLLDAHGVEDLLSKVRTDAGGELTALLDATRVTRDPAQRCELYRRMGLRLEVIQHIVIEKSEQLYRSALEATERAEKALAEFDRQSEGALARASAAVEQARREWNASRLPGQGPGVGDRLARLEADLRRAEADELALLDERVAAREPLERTWRESATALCQAGEMLRTAMVPDAGAYLVLSRTAHDAGHSLHVDGGRRSHPPNGAEP